MSVLPPCLSGALVALESGGARLKVDRIFHARVTRRQRDSKLVDRPTVGAALVAMAKVYVWSLDGLAATLPGRPIDVMKWETTVALEFTRRELLQHRAVRVEDLTTIAESIARVIARLDALAPPVTSNGCKSSRHPWTSNR